MDFETLGAALAIAKKMPGTAAEAAERAEAAAETAVEYGTSIVFGDDGIITITANAGGE